MKKLGIIFSLVFTAVSVFLCKDIVVKSVENQRNKVAYAELNDVKHGLLSISEWKRQITKILAQEINKFDISKIHEQEIRKRLETMLNTMIDKVAENIKKNNAGTASGWVKQSFINMFVNLDEIKKGIPEYADAVMQELVNPETKGQIKSIISEQLKEYSSKTGDMTDQSELKKVLASIGASSITEARTKISGAILDTSNLIVAESILFIALCMVQFGIIGMIKGPLTLSRYLPLVICLTLLLIVGVATPMIDMEAKISQVSFALMGYPVHFENQVLYFQSKSILNVFWVMAVHPAVQMKLVGALVITFSVFFPAIKLISSALYFLDVKKAKTNAAIKFFVFKSGKWSMTDVMVVAIFMAYIGFNGIIDSQLAQLSEGAPDLAVVTTNGTMLQPGYYLFLAYAVLSLFFSGFLARVEPTAESQVIEGTELRGHMT